MLRPITIRKMTALLITASGTYGIAGDTVLIVSQTRTTPISADSSLKQQDEAIAYLWQAMTLSGDGALMSVEGLKPYVIPSSIGEGLEPLTDGRLQLNDGSAAFRARWLTQALNVRLCERTESPGSAEPDFSPDEPLPSS